MVSFIILPMVPLVANGTIGYIWLTNGSIGLPMVPFGEPVVSSALPLIGTNGITNGTIGRSTLVEP